MELFFLINSWAGHFPLLDEGMRLVYIVTLPLLATGLLALLLLLPPDAEAPSRKRVLGATLLALALGQITYTLFENYVLSLGVGSMSPRPYMTRYVNLLVLEPQDNSFPCVELIFAATLATCIWALRPRYGVLAAGAVGLLGFSRLFCGNNYVGDVGAGIVLGLGWAALGLSACKAPLAWEPPVFLPNRRLNLQMGLGAAAVLGCCATTYGFLANDARYENRLKTPWSSPATAASVLATDTRPGTTQSARTAMQEGEGGPSSGAVSDDAEVLALKKRSFLFLPEVEKNLKRILVPLAQPFHLVDVEAAPVKAGNSEYRCAALRLDVGPGGPAVRRQVAIVAKRLVQAAFQSDGQLQNLDVTAFVRGDSKKIDGSDLTFAGDEIPVFTASIQRKHLILTENPAANFPTLDAGLWLRARSRLYINDKVLPKAIWPAAPVTAGVSPLATPRASPVATPTAPAPPAPPSKTAAPWKAAAPQNTAPGIWHPQSPPQSASPPAPAPGRGAFSVVPPGKPGSSQATPPQGSRPQGSPPQGSPPRLPAASGKWSTGATVYNPAPPHPWRPQWKPRVPAWRRNVWKPRPRTQWKRRAFPRAPRPTNLTAPAMSGHNAVPPPPAVTAPSAPKLSPAPALPPAKESVPAGVDKP